MSIDNHIQKFTAYCSSLIDPEKPKWIVIILLGLLASHFYGLLSDQKTELKGKMVELSDAATDTFIPQGYVLVPLEISNATTISQLIGEYTYVDIHATNSENRKAKLLAKNLRMIKAPNNPELFAVLINEKANNLIHKLSEPVFITIKNSSKKQKEVILDDYSRNINWRNSRVTYGF